MRFSLLPKVIVPALTDVTPELLHSLGVSLLMLDFDNTIVPYTTDKPTPEMEQWFRQIRASDITVCVVSNSKRGRVPTFCEERDIPCITHACKPFSKGIRECLTRYGGEACKAALVGDQIYTDTLGANRAGVVSILVKAIDNHNFWLKARHALELPFIFLARKRRIIQ